MAEVVAVLVAKMLSPEIIILGIAAGFLCRSWWQVLSPASSFLGYWSCFSPLFSK